MNSELISIIIRAIYAIITAIKLQKDSEPTTEKDKAGIGDFGNVLSGLFSF